MGGSQGLGQGREFRIRRLLKGLASHDVVIVDTSPVLTPLNVAILYAVSDILIPIDPCVAALAGVRALENLVRTVSEFRLEFTDAGPLSIAGVLITRADRTLVSKQIEAEVRNYFGHFVYERRGPGVGEIPGSLCEGGTVDPLRPPERGSRRLTGPRPRPTSPAAPSRPSPTSSRPRPRMSTSTRRFVSARGFLEASRSGGARAHRTGARYR